MPLPNSNDPIQLSEDDPNLLPAPRSGPRIIAPKKPQNLGDEVEQLNENDPRLTEASKAVLSQGIPALQRMGMVGPAVSGGIRSLLGNVGGILGGMAGGALGSLAGPEAIPPGAITGEGAGTLGGQNLGNLLQQKYPKIFGEPATSWKDPSIEAGTQFATGLALRPLFNLMALKSARGMKPTAQGFPEGAPYSDVDVESEMQNAQGKAQTNLQDQLDNITQLQKNVRPRAIGDLFPESTAYTKKALAALQKQSIPLGGKLNSEDQAFKDYLNPLGGENPPDPKTGKVAARKPLTGTQIYSLKQKIDDGMETIDPLSKQGRILAGLSKTFTKEFDAAVKSKYTPAQYAEWQSLQQAKIDAAKTFDPVLSNKLINMGASPDATYEAVARGALKDESSARRFLDMTGDQDSLANVAIKKANDVGLNTGNRTFDARGILSELNGPNAKMYEAAIPSQRLSDYRELLTRIGANQAKSINNKVGSGPNGFNVAIGSGILSAMGHPIAGTAGLASRAYLKLNKSAIADAIENPTVLRTLLEGSKIRWDTPSSTTIDKVLVKGLQGLSGLSVSYFDNPDVNTPVESDGKKLVPQK